MRRLTFPVVPLCLLVVASAASANTIYVNNRVGSDGYDGLVESAVSGKSGPVRTIGRALKLAHQSDIIVVMDTGTPYYESITLMGRNNSGTVRYPFRIVSDGAVISGAVQIPKSGWQKIGKNLWKVTPYRKGTFQLIRAGKAVPERRRQKNERWYKIPTLKANEWCHHRGSVYYQSEPLADPNDDEFSLAQKSTGATLLNVKNVILKGLIIQHFRVDGVHLHNEAREIELDNVGTFENGRAGITVSGTSICLLKQCSVQRNRDHSVLIKGLGAMAVSETDWDKEPTAP